MPDAFAQGVTGTDGTWRIDFPLLGHAPVQDACVVAPDGRRTAFDAHLVRLGWFGSHVVDIDLAATDGSIWTPGR
jgi:hypothetical protein